MLKSITLSLLVILVYSQSLFAQDSYNDNKISVTSEVLKHEDPTNDKFYEYHNFTLKNISNEVLKFELIINFVQNGAEGSTKTADKKLVFELEPGESISGDIEESEKLTLFKSFLPGNSGKKAANVTLDINSIEINYL